MATVTHVLLQAGLAGGVIAAVLMLRAAFHDFWDWDDEPQVTTDSKLRVGYAKFSTKPVAATVNRGPLNIDVAADGSLVGIEVLDLDDPFDLSTP